MKMTRLISITILLLQIVYLFNFINCNDIINDEFETETSEVQSSASTLFEIKTTEPKSAEILEHENLEDSELSPWAKSDIEAVLQSLPLSGRDGRRKKPTGESASNTMSTIQPMNASKVMSENLTKSGQPVTVSQKLPSAGKTNTTKKTTKKATTAHTTLTKTKPRTSSKTSKTKPKTASNTISSLHPTKASKNTSKLPIPTTKSKLSSTEKKTTVSKTHPISSKKITERTKPTKILTTSKKLTTQVLKTTSVHRIKPGEVATPYVVYTLSRYGGCTGVAIDPEWVLVAGHCVTNKNGTILHDNSIEIVVGIPEILIWPKHNNRARSKRILLHEDYNENIAGNDVALIQIDKHRLNNTKMEPVKLDDQPWLPACKGYRGDCMIIGWRKSHTPNGIVKYMSPLQYVTAHHDSNGCPCIDDKETYDKLVCVPGLYSDSFCGPSIGGALVCRGKLTGITHRIIDCRLCDPKFGLRDCYRKIIYQMYTYLCPHRDWLNTNVPNLKMAKFDCSALKSGSNLFLLNNLLCMLVVSMIFKKVIIGLRN